MCVNPVEPYAAECCKNTVGVYGKIIPPAPVNGAITGPDSKPLAPGPNVSFALQSSLLESIFILIVGAAWLPKREAPNGMCLASKFPSLGDSPRIGIFFS